jgi:hypothetical protein
VPSGGPERFSPKLDDVNACLVLDVSLSGVQVCVLRTFSVPVFLRGKRRSPAICRYAHVVTVPAIITRWQESPEVSGKYAAADITVSTTDDGGYHKVAE